MHHDVAGCGPLSSNLHLAGARSKDEGEVNGSNGVGTNTHVAGWLRWICHSQNESKGGLFPKQFQAFSLLFREAALMVFSNSRPESDLGSSCESVGHTRWSHHSSRLHDIEDSPLLSSALPSKGGSGE